MKQPIMTFGVLVSMIFTLIAGGCKDSSTDPPKENEPVWKEVVFFKNADIRYLIQHSGELFVSAHIPITDKDSSVNALFVSKDGIHWDTLKTFERFVGPIAFNAETLTIIEAGRMWKYHPSFGWKMFWSHLMTAQYTRDMIWLNNELFVFDNVFTMVFSNGVGKELRDIPNEPVVSRFASTILNGSKFAYTRPYYVYKDNIFQFNGSEFKAVSQEQPKNENIRPNYPSLVFHHDILFAGFNTPSRIKKLVNQNWVVVTDSIPNTPYAPEFTPPLINRPTSIIFRGERMFVGTEWTGVIEWKDSSWINFSSGLPIAFPDYPEYKLFRAVVQMEIFNDRFFVAYGEPWSAPVVGGRGIFVYNF